MTTPPGLPGYVAIAIAALGVAADWGYTNSKVSTVAAQAAHAEQVGQDARVLMATQIQRLDDIVIRLDKIDAVAARIEEKVDKPIVVEAAK